MKAALPTNEELRLATLKEYQILDSISEELYGDAVALAAAICDTPVAAISLVDRDRQWFKAIKGIEASETPREVAFCAHAILHNEIMEIPDALKDERFSDNPLVTHGPEIRFYAGVPLDVGGGVNLGSLCVIDNKPRLLTESQKHALGVLGRQVVALLNLHKAKIDLETQQARVVHTSKMVALGEMASGVAHEINNPLAIIRLKAQMLRDAVLAGNFSVKEAEESMLKIESTTLRISDIITGLRSFARDGSRTVPAKTSLKKIVEDTLNLCASKFRSHGVEIRIGQLDESAQAICKESEISQALLNLLNNAFDAAIEVEEKWVGIELSQSDDTAMISVTDSGLGVAESIREKVMLPFFSTKPTGKGAGLGLSVTHGIAESHKGTLKFDTVNSNTRFSFALPKAA